MSVDYYIVCKSKKLLMPIFSMNMGNCWVADKRYVFDFILASGGEKMEVVHEDTGELPDWDEQEKEWSYINAWQPYTETDNP